MAINMDVDWREVAEVIAHAEFAFTHKEDANGLHMQAHQHLRVTYLLLVVLELDYARSRLLPNEARPTTPVPIRSSDDGSGTGEVVIGDPKVADANMSDASPFAPPCKTNEPV
jgi:hypothetical protein